MPEVSVDSAAEFARAAAAAVLEHLGVPFLILDRDGTVLVESKLAAAILADGHNLGRDGSRLVPLDHDAAKVLDGFLGGLGSAVELHLKLPSRNGAPPRVASLSSFTPPALTGFPPFSPVALIFIREGEGQGVIDLAAARFGLTSAEVQVVRAIIEGQSVAQFATARGISVHTARKQLNSALRKTGTTRQAKLIQLVEQLSTHPRPAVQ